MGAVDPLVENYLEADFRTIWRKRAVWLSCLFVAELFTFTALAHFDDAIQKVVALSLFVPLVHLDRRQLGLAGGHAHHPGHGPGPGDSGRLVARAAARVGAWAGAGAARWA